MTLVKFGLKHCNQAFPRSILVSWYNLRTQLLSQPVLQYSTSELMLMETNSNPNAATTKAGCVSARKQAPRLTASLLNNRFSVMLYHCLFEVSHW